MKLSDFKHNDWTKIWEGSWCLLSCSDFGFEYTKGIRFGNRPFAPQTIMFISQGHSEGWMTQSDRDFLGRYLSSQVVRNPKVASQVATELIKQSKSIINFTESHKRTPVSQELFDEFWARVMVYYKPHINVKYVVDYLNPQLLKKQLPKLQKARLAAEPVFRHTEEFTKNLAKKLGKKIGMDYKLILVMTREEIGEYFLHNKLPSRQELQRRNKRAAFLHENGLPLLFTGKDVDRVLSLVHIQVKESKVKGAVAFPGKVIGKARIVPDPTKVKVFEKGDVLIAGSTRPEFLPIMKKAAAFVTDAGGILSHAAIVARELKKPCVIGTLIATKVFKDGDLVEVDANKGIVRKI